MAKLFSQLIAGWLLLFCILPASAAEPTVAPVAEMIAFMRSIPANAASGVTPQSNIYFVRVDGTGLPDNVELSGPSWLSDRQRSPFVTDKALKIIYLPSRQRRILYRGQECSSLAWQPVAYASLPVARTRRAKSTTTKKTRPTKKNYKTANAKTTVVKAYVTLVKDADKYSPPHGDIYVLQSNGKTVRLTNTKMCSEPKVAADKQTLGWYAGRYTDWDEGDGSPTHRIYVADRIVIYRNGRSLCSIKPQGARRIGGTEVSNMRWHFYNGTRQIVVRSAGSHGPDFFELFDTATGKLLDEAKSYEKSLPAWTKQLAD